MKVYILLIQDKHADTKIQVYMNKNIAVKSARELAVELGGEQFKEIKLAGWVYYAQYSKEGDNVRVQESKILR